MQFAEQLYFATLRWPEIPPGGALDVLCAARTTMHSAIRRERQSTAPKTNEIRQFDGD